MNIMGIPATVFYVISACGLILLTIWVWEKRFPVFLSIAERFHIDSNFVTTWIARLVVFGGGAWFLYQLFIVPWKENRVAKIHQSQADANITALALKFNAVTNWEATLPNRDHLFSVDLSRALIQTNGQPVLMRMDLEDIQETKSNFIAVFDESDVSPHGFELSISLKCSAEQAAYLMKTGAPSSSSAFVIVARVTETRRPRIRLQDEDTEAGARIEIDTKSDLYFAQGELLDVIQTP